MDLCSSVTKTIKYCGKLTLKASCRRNPELGLVLHPCEQGTDREEKYITLEVMIYLPSQQPRSSLEMFVVKLTTRVHNAKQGHLVGEESTCTFSLLDARSVYIPTLLAHRAVQYEHEDTPTFRLDVVAEVLWGCDVASDAKIVDKDQFLVVES